MSDKVLRHPLSVRLTHWTVALSGLVLIFSGFGNMPMYQRYNVVKIPGLSWSGNYELQLVIHYVAAIVFSVAVLFHIVYHLRRREFAAWPRRGDLAESWHIVKAMIRGKEEPPHGKFLAEQRLAYLAFVGASAVLLVTGLIKVYKNTGVVILDPTFLMVVTLIHTGATMIFLFLVIAHLGAFIIKANWPLIPSMFTGKVKRAYAEKRHPLWKVDRQ